MERRYNRRALSLRCSCVAALAFAALAWGQSASRVTLASVPAEAQARMHEAIEEIRSVPRSTAEYDYIMTARVRLLLFWAGKDDVGGGYIRRGMSMENQPSEFFQIVMGSDPAKAPRAINRWGAASERVLFARQGSEAQSSTFFGFMKVYKGNSPDEMRKELDGEKGSGQYLFSAILNQADADSTSAKTVPFTSNTDYNIHQMDAAEPVVFDQLQNTQGKFRLLDPEQYHACGRPEGFLSSVAELVDSALDGRATPEALCYVYNGQLFRLTLTHVAPVEHESVRVSLDGASQPYTRDYSDLRLARFDNYNETMRQGSSFELLLGTKGNLRGVPVRISYQPNWWFQVVLNLKTPEETKTAELR